MWRLYEVSVSVRVLKCTVVFNLIHQDLSCMTAFSLVSDPGTISDPEGVLRTFSAIKHTVFKL